MSSGLKSTAAPANPEDPCSLVILDGALCRVNRKGRVVLKHEPIGTAIVQFRQFASGNIVTLEHPYGFLEGFSNLACLDERLRLRWFFALPSPPELYAEMGESTDDYLELNSTAGARVRVNLSDGTLVTAGVVAQPVA